MKNSTNQKDLNDDVLEIGGRLNHQPSKILIDQVFATELQQQLKLFEPIGWVDLAFTLVSIESEMIPRADGCELIGKLLELQECASTFCPIPERGDLYTNREAWLSERTHTVGWLGAGRARREATTTAFLILERQLVVDVIASLVRLGEALVSRAREFKTGLMPDYTYLQSAQPTTFGHYLLSFVYPILRDCERLRQLYDRINASPVGCGSTTGSSLVRDRQRMAELLGFERLAVHTRDAMWQADIPIETMASLTACCVNMSRLAEDLQIFSTQEFGLIELNDCHARASKIMPQKKNPFALTHIRAVCNELMGTLTVANAVGRTPSGQPDNRLWAYGAIPQAILKVQGTADLLTELIGQLIFNSIRGRQMVKDVTIMATDLAEFLVREHRLDFRAAHRIVGYLTRRHIQSGDPIDKNSIAKAAEDILGMQILINEDVLHQSLDPAFSLELHRQPGSPAAVNMAEMLDSCEAQLRDIQSENMRLLSRIKEFQTRLMAEARKMVIS